MKFNNNDDLKKFALSLSKSLEEIGECVLAKELGKWNNEFFTTSTEFLGELKLILLKINDLQVLDGTTKNDLKECIRTIEKALAR